MRPACFIRQAAPADSVLIRVGIHDGLVLTGEIGRMAIRRERDDLIPIMPRFGITGETRFQNAALKQCLDIVMLKRQRLIRIGQPLLILAELPIGRRTRDERAHKKRICCPARYARFWQSAQSRDTPGKIILHRQAAGQKQTQAKAGRITFQRQPRSLLRRLAITGEKPGSRLLLGIACIPFRCVSLPLPLMSRDSRKRLIFQRCVTIGPQRQICLGKTIMSLAPAAMTQPFLRLFLHKVRGIGQRGDTLGKALRRSMSQSGSCPQTASYRQSTKSMFHTL